MLGSFGVEVHLKSRRVLQVHLKNRGDAGLVVLARCQRTAASTSAMIGGPAWSTADRTIFRFEATRTRPAPAIHAHANKAIACPLSPPAIRPPNAPRARNKL